MIRRTYPYAAQLARGAPVGLRQYLTGALRASSAVESIPTCQSFLSVKELFENNSKMIRFLSRWGVHGPWSA